MQSEQQIKLAVIPGGSGKGNTFTSNYDIAAGAYQVYPADEQVHVSFWGSPAPPKRVNSSHYPMPPHVVGLAASLVSGTSFKLTWTAAIGATSYRVDLIDAATGLYVGSYSDFTVTTNEITFADLTPGTAYRAYVYSVINASVSQQSLPFNQSTTVAAATKYSLAAALGLNRLYDHSGAMPSDFTVADSLAPTDVNRKAVYSSTVTKGGLALDTTLPDKTSAKFGGIVVESLRNSSGVITPVQLTGNFLIGGSYRVHTGSPGDRVIFAFGSTESNNPVVYLISRFVSSANYQLRVFIRNLAGTSLFDTNSLVGYTAGDNKTLVNVTVEVWLVGRVVGSNCELTLIINNVATVLGTFTIASIGTCLFNTFSAAGKRGATEGSYSTIYCGYHGYILSGTIPSNASLIAVQSAGTRL